MARAKSSRLKGASKEEFQSEKENAGKSSVAVNPINVKDCRREQLILLIKDAERKVSERKCKIKAAADMVISSIEHLFNLELMRYPVDILDMKFHDYLEQLKSGSGATPVNSATLEAECKAAVSKTRNSKKKTQARKIPATLSTCEAATKVFPAFPVRRSQRKCAQTSRQALRDRQNTEPAGPSKSSQ